MIKKTFQFEFLLGKKYAITINMQSLIIQCKRVKAVCVIGIPDETAGDLPAAVIVQNDNEPIVTQHEIEQMLVGEILNLINIPCRFHMFDSNAPDNNGITYH